MLLIESKTFVYLGMKKVIRLVKLASPIIEKKQGFNDDNGYDILCGREDIVKLLFQNARLRERPVGLFLVTENNIIENRTRNAQMVRYIRIYFGTFGAESREFSCLRVHCGKNILERLLGIRCFLDGDGEGSDDTHSLMIDILETKADLRLDARTA